MSTRISYSAVDQFKECPKKYWNSRTHKIRSEASALGFGSAFEAAVEHLIDSKDLEEAIHVFETQWEVRPANRWEGEKKLFDSEDMFFYQSDYDKYLIASDEDQKLVTDWYSEIYGNLPKLDPVEWHEQLLENISNGIPISKQDTKFMHRVMWLCCMRRGPLMIEAFHRDILPTIKEVLAVQKEIEITNEDGDKVTGYIDWIVEIENVKGPAIMDLKSAGKFYEDHDLDTSDQLGIYALSEGIPNIGYWVVSKKIQYEVKCDKCGHVRENGRLKNCEKDKCKGKYTIRKPYTGTQILTKRVDDEFLDSVENDFSEVMIAIKNKISWKNKKSCFNFGTRCEFYDHCWKGVPLDKLATVKKKD